MRDHRRQLRKFESRQKKEKQKSDRILKTFQSAVEAVTPHSSIVMSPGGAKEDSSGPQHFSATPLSSWHHIVMSNSSRYSVTNMSNIHLPMLRGATPYRPTSSSGMRSYSQPNLSADSPRSAPDKSISAQGVRSDPEMSHSKLSPTANSLTRSRPALNVKQSEGKSKVKAKKMKKKKPKKNADEASKNPAVTVKWHEHCIMLYYVIYYTCDLFFPWLLCHAIFLNE